MTKLSINSSKKIRFSNAEQQFLNIIQFLEFHASITLVLKIQFPYYFLFVLYIKMQNCHFYHIIILLERTLNLLQSMKQSASFHQRYWDCLLLFRIHLKQYY